MIFAWSFFRDKGVGMDKISAVLIFGIMALIITSVAIVYDTWIKQDFAVYEVIIIEAEESQYL